MIMENIKKLIFIVLAAVIVLGLVGVVYWFSNQGSDNNGGVVCTMEVLQCPDGSYVGRRGLQCKFAACPTPASLTGTLQQDSSGFALIFGSPENGGGEVAYRMPIVLKVSNVVGQLVGRKVRVFGAFTEGATFAVDRLEELPGDSGDSTLGEIGAGKSSFINGVRITLNKIVQDSRCPIDVQCIQAGWVTANVTLKSNTDEETRDITTGKDPIPFDSYQISIEDVKPVRMAGSETKSENYLITFRVRSNN